MNVSLLDLKAQYSSLQSELEEALLQVARSQVSILGPEVAQLESSLAPYCDAEYAVGVSSGTDAQLMALMALNIGPGDEVIVPTYSFFATAGVVSRLNATPVFVDSEPLSMNIDVAAIEAKITARTKAIMPVHLFGQAADIEAIKAIASPGGIPVIEDAAQAIGTQLPSGKRVGSAGLMGTFSFYPTKNLGAFGDGGLLTTNDKELATRLIQMRNHGMEPKYHHRFVGGNFRLDAIQAAVLNVKFPHLASWHQARRDNAALYDRLFAESGLSSSALQADTAELAAVTSGAKAMPTPVITPTALYSGLGHADHHIYNQYIVRVQRRDELRAFLASKFIGTEIYYPVPFHRQECFADLGAVDSDYPVANFAAEHSLALPIYPELSDEAIEYVVSTIAEFYR